MGPGRPQIAKGALVAFALGVAILGGDVMGLLPWPSSASRSLAGLFVLAAVTRAAGDLGVKAQRRFRPAVAGVALTAAVWFAGGSRLAGNPALAHLALAHLAVVWLAAAPEPDAAERERDRLVLAAAMAAVSLVAMAALPAASRIPGAPKAPLALAVATVAAAFHVARGRMGGLVVQALAGTVTFVLTARVFADLVTLGGVRSDFGRTAPLLAATAALGAIPPIVALALRLPQLFRVLVPKASPPLRSALAWLTLPLVAAVAVAILAP